MRKKGSFFKNFYSKAIAYLLTNRLFLSYLFLSLFGCILFRIITLSQFGFRATICDLGIVIFIGSFGYLFKPKNQHRYFLICLSIFTLMFIANSLYYIFYGDFASVGELSTLGQAQRVTNSIVDKLRFWDIFYIFIPLLFSFIHIKLNNSAYYSYISKIEKSKKMFLFTILLGLSIIGFRFAIATSADYNRLKKQWTRQVIVERFGLIFYQGNDVIKVLSPRINSLFGYENAKKLFNDYYSSDNYSKYRNTKNKYTNILKGKNIVFVHMESIQDFLLDESFNGKDLMPNTKALAKEGMFFTNFYPQVSTGTSSDTEFTLLSSLMPASSGTIFVSYYNRKYITLPNLLKEKNYYTFSMHGNNATMWNRAVVHPLLGYDHMFFDESFTYTDDDIINLGINDELFFEQAIPILEKIEEDNKNYMGTVITLSNHSPFVFTDKYEPYDLSTTYKEYNSETNKIEIKKSDYLKDSAVGMYMLSAHYADKALGEFISYVKKSKHFNDTVFIFYGDHDAKLSQKEMNYLYNYNYKTGEVYDIEDEKYTEYDTLSHNLNKKTPLIIWTKNSELKKVFKGEINYYMGMLDVAPTLYNMLGISNPYALGNDIFTIKNNNIVVFPHGNFLTNVLYYNSSTEEYSVINNHAVITEEYLENVQKYTEDLLDVSDAIITYNLLGEDGGSDD